MGTSTRCRRRRRTVTVAEPETIDAFEIGLKGNWFDGRVGFAAQLFYYDYQDYQVLTVEDSSAGPPGIAIINANDAEIYGAEIEVRVEPVDALVLTGRFGWLESQYPRLHERGHPAGSGTDDRPR